MDPTLRRHLLHQVVRVLNVLLENGDLGILLLGEEGLRNSTAFLAHTYLFRMDQQGLHVLVATTACHVGNRQERAGLGPGLTPVRLEAGLVADVGVRIDGRVVVSVALTGINQKLVDGSGIHTGSIGNKIGREISAWPDALGIVRLNAAQIVPGVGHSINVHVGTAHSSGRVIENYGNCLEIIAIIKEFYNRVKLILKHLIIL